MRSPGPAPDVLVMWGSHPCDDCEPRRSAAGLFVVPCAVHSATNPKRLRLARRCHAVRARDGARCIGVGLHPGQDHYTARPDNDPGDAYVYSRPT